jgi:hypothetical protein
MRKILFFVAAFVEKLSLQINWVLAWNQLGKTFCVFQSFMLYFPHFSLVDK